MSGGGKVNILLHGCNGKMGQVMTRVLAAEENMKVVAGVDIDPGKCSNAYPVYPSLSEVRESPDILIDFSHHTSLDAVLEYGLSDSVPLLICTTGFTPEEKRRMAEASLGIPILNSANMSLGVNLLLSLVDGAARALHETFDIEIVEKHHNQKVDSPSGTAIMIAEAIESSIGDELELKFGRHSKTEKRTKREIGIHSIRGGAIVGEHDVIFAGQGEVVQITHTALSRDVFAYGAVRAARFLVGKEPGLYSMKDVIASR
jgi:4-hydroxy-tetrahydrodipicolinate reductase